MLWPVYYSRDPHRTESSKLFLFVIIEHIGLQTSMLVHITKKKTGSQTVHFCPLSDKFSDILPDKLADHDTIKTVCNEIISDLFK